MIKKFLIVLGILFKRPLTGPLEVGIDITNRCGIGCITCWFYSPLKKEPIREDWKRQRLSLEVYKKLVDDLKRKDVKKIMLGGDGDPMTHPHIVEMINYAKSKGFYVGIATKGAFFNEKSLRSIFDSGINELSVSILAATRETYKRMHPTQPAEQFDRIKEHVTLLSKWKREEKKSSPLITLVYVVCNVNYTEAVEMINLAREIGAQKVAYKRMDTIPDIELLLLDKEQKEQLNDKLLVCESLSHNAGIKVNVSEFRSFTLSGLTDGNYTSQLYDKVPCYTGWLYSRILVSGDVVACCGCCDKKLGNVNERSFIEIWNSKEYTKFRIKMRNIVNDKTIMKVCSCHSCVHFSGSYGVYRKLHPLRARGVLKNEK